MSRAVALTRLIYSKESRISCAPRVVSTRVRSVPRDFLRLYGVENRVVGTMQIVSTSIHLRLIGNARTVFRGRGQFVVPIVRLIRQVTRAGKILLPTPFTKLRVKILSNYSRIEINLLRVFLIYTVS